MGPKNKFSADSDEGESFSEFIVRSMDETFIDNIPMDAIKDLPKFYMYLFGAFGELFSLGVFCYFLWSVYEQGVQQYFISITPSSGQCSEIPKAVSGSYTADENGNWAGSPNFDPSKGIYEITLTDAQFTFSDYADAMDLAEKQINLLSAASVHQNLATNLLVYMSWQFNCIVTDSTPYCSSFTGQSFTFTADAAFMFSVSYLDVTLSNQKADCLSLSVSGYDLANAINTGSYDYPSFMADPTCNTTVVPEHLGYDGVLDGPTFSIGMDVRTMIDSVAINYGLLDVTSMNTVGDTEVIPFEYNGYSYTARYYIDTWYAGSHPLFCAVNSASKVNPTLGVEEICVWIQNNITGLPLFLHYGAGDGVYFPVSPMPCDW